METGISLMERDCHCLVRCCMSAVDLRELTYVELVVMDQLVSIAVIFQLKLSIISPTPQTGSGGKCSPHLL